MYLLHGKLTAKSGQNDKLAEILIRASEAVSKAPGCRLYAISRDEKAPNDVYVTEIWESRQHHDDSLKEDGVLALIREAMPLLDGMPEKGQELEVLGGFGV